MDLTSRLKKIQKRLFDVEYHDPGTWHFLDVNILDGNSELEKEPLVVRKAMAQKYMGEHLPAIIKDDELICGNPNQNSVGWGTIMPIYYTEEEGFQASRYMLNEASVWGHHPPKWWEIINDGVVSVRAKINAAAEVRKAAAEPNEEALTEYRAMLVALDGLVAFANRHAAAAETLAREEEDPVRKAELLEMAAICRKVPENPSETLQEAAQAYWFTYCLVNSGGEYVPLGRADQYLYPYFKRDLEEGRITEEKAIDIIGSFLVKCNERIITDTRKAENHYTFGLFSQGNVPDEAAAKTITGGYDQRGLTWQDDEDDDSEANFNYGQSGNDWLMNCIVGGTDSDGNDVTNELSYLILDIMHDMKLLMPTMGARVHKNCPESFRRKIAEVLRYGQGEPMIYNDDFIVPGFVDIGVPVEDARHYTNDGCWETLIPGKSYFSYAHVMNLQCLEWVLFRGKSLLRDAAEGLDTGDPEKLENFEEFYAAYKKQVDARIDFQCHRRLENFGLSYMIAPDPLMSSIVDDCIDKGKDLSQDGARFIFHQILITGLSNTVDSLAVIKKLVFEDKSVSLKELIEAIRNNWKGFERLRARVINEVPKFGNDIDFVDTLGIRVMKDFEDSVARWNKKQDTMKFPVGIGTFENYAVLGRGIAASADGRTNGAQLAPNYSPNPGADIEGPTAVIKSITKPILLKYYSGCPLDLAINSNEFEGEAGIDRLNGLIKSFCDLGGQILTVTSTNVEDLKDAKENPEMHRDLRVRMGGLSAYFIAMSPVQQDNIIKRFDKGGCV